MGSVIVFVGFVGFVLLVLFLGNCLLNSDWICVWIGSLLINFSNVIEICGFILFEFCVCFIVLVYQEEVMMYVRDVFFLMVNLYECMGYVLGMFVEGIKGDELKDIYSVIEECRVDLVVYYKFVDFYIVIIVYFYVIDIEVFV